MRERGSNSIIAHTDMMFGRPLRGVETITTGPNSTKP
jgi:hypothetical protein